MKDRSPIPTALQIVAVLFLFYGISSVVSVIISLASGSLNIDLGVLGIPTFFGLRRLSIGWRTFALVCIWIALIMSPILFFVGIFGNAPTYIRISGIRTAEVAPIWLSVVSFPIFLLELWQYRVLTNPQVRALFFACPDAPNVA